MLHKFSKCKSIQHLKAYRGIRYSNLYYNLKIGRKQGKKQKTRKKLRLLISSTGIKGFILISNNIGKE